MFGAQTLRCPHADRAGRALDRVLDAIGKTTDPNQLEALGQTVAALVTLLGSSESTVAAIVVNALKLPNLALDSVDEAVIAPLHALHPDMPADGFWAVVDWLRDRYPSIDFEGPLR